MKRKEILDKIKALGWEYEEKYWDDGSVMVYMFKLHDAMEAENYWEVSIEDHHDEGDVNDWIIFSSYHDSKEKDWYGRQIDTLAAVEYSTMKLIMDFVSVIDEEKYGGKS